MRKVWMSGVMLSAAVVGCGPSGPGPVKPVPPVTPDKVDLAPSTDPVVATIGTTSVRQSVLNRATLDAHGLKVLIYVSQYEMVKDACKAQGILITEDDVVKERKWTLNHLLGEVSSEDDTRRLLEQFYNTPKAPDKIITPAEMDIIIRTNAGLRKLVEPSSQNVISDDELKLEFDRMYGSQVRVRHIMVSNAQEAAEVKRQLAAGKEFAEVARLLSRNPQTKLLGGELPPFASKDPRYPANFRSVAFSMKEGEVSDPVITEGSYHIIKLDEKIAPKAVKFEDVRDSLKESIRENYIIEAMNQLRNKFAAQARANMKIEDPELRGQFEKKMRGTDVMLKDREKISKEMQKQRDTIAAPTTIPAAAEEKPPAATAPSGATTETAPANAPATQP